MCRRQLPGFVVANAFLKAECPSLSGVDRNLSPSGGTRWNPHPAPGGFKRPCQDHQMTLLPPATSECLAALVWHKAELGRQPHPPTPAAQSQRAKLRQRLSAAPSINCSGFFFVAVEHQIHTRVVIFCVPSFALVLGGFWRRTWGILFKYETRRVLGVSFCSSNGQTRV
jgi:hypothetical protein